MRVVLGAGLLLLMLLIGPASADEIIAIGNATTDEGQVVFTLKYHTSLAKTDDAALRKEADLYWQRAVQDVENSRRLRAVFTAVGHVPGEKEDWTRDFVFARRGPGNWHTLEAEDRTKLDEPFVRVFFERFDADAQRKLTDAMLLYVAPEWVLTTQSEAPNASAQPDMGRADFSRAMHFVLFVASKYKLERKIDRITISKDGLSTEVESHEVEDLDLPVARQHRQTVSRSTDSLELRGRFVLLTKAAAVIEKETETAAK